VHYCEECGKKESARENVCIDDNLHNLLEGLLRTRKNEVDLEPVDTCEICGTTVKEIIKYKTLGCPNCYELFSDSIESLRTRSKNEYRESAYCNDESLSIGMLRKELKDAVRLEDFEKAASLRDRIRDCEKEGFLSDN
jgi:protein arginine kinase activator